MTLSIIPVLLTHDNQHEYYQGQSIR